MKVIDKVKIPGYAQWCPNFVKRVITRVRLEMNGKAVDTVEIVDVDDQCIYLKIGGMHFIIRMWHRIPCEYDENVMVCAEMMEYLLFCSDVDYALTDTTFCLYGKPIDYGVLKIRWSNSEARRRKEVATYQRLHSIA